MHVLYHLKVPALPIYMGSDGHNWRKKTVSVIIRWIRTAPLKSIFYYRNEWEIALETSVYNELNDAANFQQRSFYF